MTSYLKPSDLSGGDLLGLGKPDFPSGQAPSDIFTKPKSGGGLGGGGSLAGQRARDDAKKTQEAKDWNEATAGIDPPPQQATRSSGIKPRLARVRFLGKDHRVGDMVGVACDTLDGATAQGVVFTVLGKDAKGEWADRDRVTGQKASQGSGAEMLLNKPYDQGDNTPITFKVKATHQGAETVESAPITAEPEEDFDGILYYSPKREAYLLLESQDEALPFLEKMQQMHDLNEARLSAWREPDLQKRNVWLEEVEKKTDAMFGGKANVKADKAFEELIQVQGNKAWGKSHEWAYLPDEQSQKGRWVEKKAPEVVKKLEKVRQKVIKQSNKRSQARYAEQKQKGQQQSQNQAKKNESDDSKAPIWKGSLKAQLFEKEIEPYKYWEWAAYHKKKDFLKKADGSDNPYFDFSGEAAVMRFIAGWSGPEIDFKPHKGTLTLGASGAVSFAVREGKLSGSVSWPSEKGVNMLGFLGEIKHKESFIEKGRGVFMRLHLSGVASYFEGVSIKGALAFPKIDFSKANVKKEDKGSDATASKRKNEVGAKASIHGLVGAQAKVEGSLAVQWHMAGASKFDTLAEVKGEAAGTSGFAAKFEMEIAYSNGKFIFKASAGLAKGLGGEGGYSYEVGFDEGVVLIGYLLDSVNWHYIKAIQIEAFNAYTDYTFAMMVEGVDAVKENATDAVARVENFTGWFSKEATRKMTSIKSYIRSFADKVHLMRRSSPEALGRALNVLMRTREDDDFEHILYILKFAQSDHKLRWIVREIPQVALPPETAPNYESEKERLYQEGKKMLFVFGMGDGTPKAKPNENYLSKLQVILGAP